MGTGRVRASEFGQGSRIMVKENPIHKQQIDPVLMADRFPFYDLDGCLAADAAEILNEIPKAVTVRRGSGPSTSFNVLMSAPTSFAIRSGSPSGIHWTICRRAV